MKINRFNQFVKENLNEGTTQAPPTTRPVIPERPGKPIHRPEVRPGPKAEFDEEDNLNPNIDSSGFEEEDNFGDNLDNFEDDFMDDEEAVARPSRNVRSFDDFQDDEDLSDEEEFAGEYSEREPDETDYMPSFNSEEEEDFGGEEEEAGEYKGEVEMRRLADMLGTEVINNQIEYNGKKINYFSETEMFHVDRKKFETPEDVIEYLEGGSNAPTNQPNPMEMEERGEEGFEEEESPMEEEEERRMTMESRRFRRR